MAEKQDTEGIVPDINRPTRKKYSNKQKIRIVLAGLKGEICASSTQRSIFFERLVSNLFTLI